MTQGVDQDRRGSHATVSGQGFSWVLLWTILGALVPGTGLIAAGRRLAGGLVLAVLGLGVLALAAAALFGNPVDRIVKLAVNPQQLLILAVAGSFIALVWVAVIVLTNTELRRFASLTTGQGAFSWLVVVALVVGVGVPTYEFSHDALIQRDLINSVFDTKNQDAAPDSSRPNTAKADPWAGKSRVNVLLIGSDAGADRTGTRPDTMILASINPQTGNTLLFSLPRNLENAPFVAGSPGAQRWPNGYNCGDECLLNAIWTWASAGEGLTYYKKYKNPGLRATEDAVEGVTGLTVDTYVMLNLKGFQEFVDAIGGITVDVHKRLPIGGNGDPNSPVYHVATNGWIEAGDNQHLNGFKALWFARSRWAYDDYDRMQRQRCVIGDVVSQTDPVTVAKAFPKIAKALKTNLSTGIPRSDLGAWVDLSTRIKGASVKSLPFTAKVINPGHPDFDKIHELVNKAITASDKPKPTATPTVPGATPSSTSTPKPKPSKTATIDDSKAQDVTKVC